MSDVLLDLPESLRHQLEERAQERGLTLQALILDSLAQVMTIPDVAEQRAVFGALRNRYPQDQAEAALREILAARE